MSVQSNELRYYLALKRIGKGYDSAEKVMRTAGKRYGLSDIEALSDAYDNLQSEARASIYGKRKPKQ